MGIKDKLAVGALSTILTVGGVFDASAQEEHEGQRNQTEITQDQQADLSKIPANTVHITVDGIALAGRDYQRSLSRAQIKNAQNATDFAENVIEKLDNGTMSIPRGYSNTTPDEDHIPLVQVNVLNGQKVVHTFEQDLGEEENNTPTLQQDQDGDLSQTPASSVKISVDGVAIAGRGYARLLGAAQINTVQDATDFADSVIEKLDNGTMNIPTEYATRSAQGEDHTPIVKVEILNGRSVVHTYEQGLGEEENNAPKPETPDGP